MLIDLLVEPLHCKTAKCRFHAFNATAWAGVPIMADTSGLTRIAGMTPEMRDSALAAFDALSNWRDEIEATNERCLDKVMDKMSGVARSMGWPEQAIRGTREILETASKAQTSVIDQIMANWKKQLASPTDPLAVPRDFAGRVPEGSAATLSNAMPEFNPLAPWTFWMQAAQAWQRSWMPEAAPRRDRSH
jgi:hypothetical protein